MQCFPLMGDLALPGEALPQDTRLLAELLAERLDMAIGTCRVELELQNGVLRAVWRHDRTAAAALRRFDPPPRGAAGRRQG